MLLVDTNIWLEAADKRARHREVCRAILAARRCELGVTVPTIAETAWILLDRLGPVAQLSFLRTVALGQVTVVDLTQADWARCTELVATYASMRLDILDASIVAFAERVLLKCLNAAKFELIDHFFPEQGRPFELEMGLAEYDHDPRLGIVDCIGPHRVAPPLSAGPVERFRCSRANQRSAKQGIRSVTFEPPHCIKLVGSSVQVALVRLAAHGQVSAQRRIDSRGLFSSNATPINVCTAFRWGPCVGVLFGVAAYDYRVTFDRIAVDPGRMGGVACIRTLRFPVATVVAMVADGMSNDEILFEHPDLEMADISEALRYAALALQERELPLRRPA